MALPTCISLPDAPPQLEITMPGGAIIASLQAEPKKIPTSDEVVMSLLGQLGPAMAPLKPVFDIIDTVIALFDCVKAIPDALGPPPDPSAIIACIPEVTKKVDTLLKLIPQLSVPFMIVDAIDAVIAAINGVISLFEGLASAASDLQARAEIAQHVGDPNLDAIIECAQANVAKQQASATDALAGIASIIGVVNIFMGLIGGPELSLSVDADIPLDEAIQPLRDLIDALTTARNAVPIP